MSESELFVVRVWRQWASDFRAAVRRVDEEQTHHFSQPDEVVRFLRAAAQTGAGPDDAAPAVAASSANLKA